MSRPQKTVARIRLSELTIPLKRPFTFRFGQVSERNYSIAEVWDDEGTRGLAYSLTRTVSAARLAARIARPLVGAAFSDPRGLLSEHPAWKTRTELSTLPLAGGRALLEIALWDLYARELSVPVSALFGRVTRPLSAIAVLGYVYPDEPDSTLADVDLAVRQGYAGVKLPIGDRPLEQEVDLLDEIRTRYPAIRIHLDAHWNYDSRAEAQEAVARLSPFDIVWFEDLMPAHIDPRWLGNQPEAVGDDVITPGTLIDALDAGLTVRPDITAVGIASWMRVTSHAERIGGAVTNHVHRRLHVPLLSTLRAVHPSGAERFLREADVDPIETLLDGGADVKNGVWELSTAAGFGYSLDEGQRSKWVTYERDFSGLAG